MGSGDPGSPRAEANAIGGRIMRKFCVLTIAIASFFGATWGATPASAWEFQMSGSMTWLYEDYTQRGSQGFFGPYNVDAGVDRYRQSQLLVERREIIPKHCHRRGRQ